LIIKNGIEKALKSNAARFFTPGHTGDGFLPLYYDVTELEGTDNLQNPLDIISDATKNAAFIYGASKSFFLVNGSSIGIHALVMSTCRRGDTLIVDRGCHISVINAIILNDIKPIYIQPKYNKKFGITTHISPADIELALNEYPHAKGVLITSPNYYGMCCDVKKIAQIVRKHSSILLVDEAHGAHFAFSNALPATALSYGADGVVQSTHKTLPCITQGALLHLGGNKLCRQTVQQNLNMLQTTSPSYLIMMSVDNAIQKAAAYPKKEIDCFVKRCRAFKEKINKTEQFKCLDNGDDTRLVVNAGKNATKVNFFLRENYNIISEMCDGQNIIFIAKLFYGMGDVERLESALIKISDKLDLHEGVKNLPPPKLQLKISPSDAYYSSTEALSPQNAVGKIAARAVYKMPPCTALITPGEVITKAAASQLNEDIFVVKGR